MPNYRVFVGAPSVAEVLEELDNPIPSSAAPLSRWEITRTTLTPENLQPRVVIQETQPQPRNAGRLTMDPVVRARLDAEGSRLIGERSDGSLSSRRISELGENVELLLPETTMLEASRRLSKLYEGLDFGDDQADEESLERIIDDSRDSRNTSAISWDPTFPSESTSRTGSGNASAQTSHHSFAPLSRDTGPRKSLLSATYASTEESAEYAATQLETQEDEETQDTGLNDTADDDSIGRFPTFHFSLHKITPLKLFLDFKAKRKERRAVSLLVAVLDVEGPNVIMTKMGVEMGLLKVIVGDELGAVTKVTAWRETAMKWGGGEGGEEPGALRKGDVVLLENVILAYLPPAAPTITASPTDRSKMTICYRTLPIVRADRKYRPDLRLAQSDAALRKVAAVVEWVEEMANIHRP